MAVSRMMKILIATYRGEAGELLEELQQAGIVQVLDAERAMVSKDWPELQIDLRRPKDLDEMVARLDKCITFLRKYATDKGPVSIFRPLVVIDKDRYSEVVSGRGALDLLEQAEQVSAEIDRLNTEYENCQATYEGLYPWRGLSIPVEEIAGLKTTTCMAGMIGHQHFEEVTAKLSELGAAIEQVGSTGNADACLIVCMNETVAEIQKVLRSGDFEQARFEEVKGMVGEFLEDCEENLARLGVELGEAMSKAGELAKERLKLQILYDHYENLLAREQTKALSPTSEYVVLFEGWAKRKDYERLEEMVGKFGASTITEVLPGEGEEPPVEIENNRVVRPFEVITRLYGMPQYLELDPTVFLAPFFALFFGLCLTDAGYGLVMIAVIAYLLKKMQGNKNLMWMLIVCSITTVIAGALTGGWFGDAIQVFAPGMDGLRNKLMLFDPLEQPMVFFYLSLALGYFQLIFGLIIAFVHNLRRKDYVAAVCDQLTWLVMLNSIMLFAAGKAGAISPQVGKFFGVAAFVPAITILLFSQRQGQWAGRIGMGCFQLFSTIFWMGDMLSYLRLMALGMVTAGLGLAINVITGIVADLPYGIGFVAGPLVFVLGHSFNIAMSGLGAFVHTLRLQYVEFFPKFVVGGGRSFEPFSKAFKHIYIKK